MGWYNRSSMRTYRPVGEIGSMLCFSDNYAVDLPFWNHATGKPELFIPFTPDANDMRFAISNGFAESDQLFTYLRDTFDTLYREGQAGQQKMMSIYLHGRLSGRQGRCTGLVRFLDDVMGKPSVGLAKRKKIARHWWACHSPISEA